MQALVKFIFGFLLIAFLVTGSLAVEEKTSKQILILASYNPGLRWTDSIGSEIENQLAIFYPTANFVFEYMDTKKQAPTKTRLAELLELYQNKYKNRHFDVIICSDDDAFQFLRNNRDELFPGSPVVFCGVNFFEDKMLAGKKGFHGRSGGVRSSRHPFSDAKPASGYKANHHGKRQNRHRQGQPRRS